MARGDPALGAWVENRTAFDEQCAEAFATAAAPVALRDEILRAAPRPGAEKPRARWFKPAFIVTAAAAACIIIGWFYFSPASSSMPAWQADSLAAMFKIEHGMARLDERAPDLEAVKKLLAATSSPSPTRLPVVLSALGTYGCKRVQIAGRPATIICFKLDRGREAHLVVLDNKDLPDMPPQMQPRFSSSKNWHIAAWSDGDQSFLLATTAGEAVLKKLFS